MPPSLVLIFWLIFLLLLLRFDHANGPKISPALWVPVIWMFIAATRLPSQWLGTQVGIDAAAFQEGNALDRTVSSGLMLLAIVILVSRSFNWTGFFARNVALTVFLLFGLASVFWSDFPLVAVKRWFRDLGGYFVMLVVSSDRRPLEAVGALFRRLSYLVIPLSLVIVKYYPQIGRQYDSWTGVATYVGATTSKNMLGLACLVSGLFFFWDTVARWADCRKRQNRRILCVNFVLMAMTAWLLHVSSSATSTVCLVLGCLIITAAHSRTFQRHPALLKVVILATLLSYLTIIFGFGMGGLAGAVGRDPTLTDRTKIWAVLLAMNTNPVWGTGYESFWLGRRLLWVWESGVGRINEAHNGYLQVYLNLGLIGLLLTSAFLIASYRTVCRTLRPFSNFGSFSLAVWIVLLFYNTTEAAFQSGLLWFTLVPGAVVLAAPRVRRVTHPGNLGPLETPSSVATEATGRWR